jgi:hypothetical protein
VWVWLLGRVRVTAAVILLVFVMLLAVNAASVWADTFNPNPPVPGTGFSISGTASTGGFGSLFHESSCAPSSFITAVFDPSPGSFTDSFPAQSAGPYSFSHDGDASGCVHFTIQAAPPIPEYPYGLPLLAILLVIAYGLVRRRINY